MRERLSLRVIYDGIQQRADAIAGARPDWPCRRGCDDCCRRLGEVPAATRPEWERLWAAYERLDGETRRAIRARAEALVAAPAAAPHTCPFLDRGAGACLVYADRLGACRMHAFYMGRDGGRWCERILALSRSPEAAGIVWGNHEATTRALEAHGGPLVPLGVWLAEHPAAPEPAPQK